MAINHADLAEHRHERVAEIFGALAQPHRLAIVHLLADDQQRVVDLTDQLGLAQSTVSAHLAVLRQVGLVTAQPQGRATWYRLAAPGLDPLLHAAEELTGALPERTPQ